MSAASTRAQNFRAEITGTELEQLQLHEHRKDTNEFDPDDLPMPQLLTFLRACSLYIIEVPVSSIAL